MACRGVHFAIPDDILSLLRDAGTDAEVREVISIVEERWEEEAGLLYETDKAWDPIHRCLTGGRLAYDSGTPPLSLCILGGEQLHAGEEYVVSLVTHDQLANLIAALAIVTPEFLRERYWQLPEDYVQPKSQEDCDYTWDWFSGLPAFYQRAAEEGRHVIFTVDQ